jgi:hypothetical protein
MICEHFSNSLRFYGKANELSLRSVVNYVKISLIIHEEKTKEITTASVVLYVIKNHDNLHKL